METAIGILVVAAGLTFIAFICTWAQMGEDQGKIQRLQEWRDRKDEQEEKIRRLLK